MRTFSSVRKQVDDRKRHRRPRGGVHVALNDILTYLFELKAFHVKHLSVLNAEGALSESEKALLAAGEHLEEATKQWLAGE